MSKIVKMIQERASITHVKYFRDFIFRDVSDDEFVGYSFPCSPNGEVDVNDSDYGRWKSTYEYCLSHPDELNDRGVQIAEWEETEPAIGLCSCGREVWFVPSFHGDCCYCSCGQWYNLFGQSIIDPDDFDN